MGYGLSIVKPPIPLDSDAAWDVYDEILDEMDQLPGDPAEEFLSLINELTSYYPEQTKGRTETAERCPWVSLPIERYAGWDMLDLTISFSMASEVVPFVIKKANQQGLVVFDRLSEKVHHP
ncbi:hypothetical protein [Candidatus Endoriftia persephone]|jgi:hypothetical protein|uniref:Uncharacterized protein n=3 Tax=Gammaproteobacteria TaxID=1236 RepID=G2FEV8_9GAMM|nr:hypothetical protein [Candidatus Endoriftia persephone]EGW54690.1 hypothetical protein TevJSym_aj00550 [endosymbiont of Tevnia jerichonana (vent Tica)]USF88430.1 hypothetical protein L0Y14_04115 [Candidatus Endoriftia persephone]